MVSAGRGDEVEVAMNRNATRRDALRLLAVTAGGAFATAETFRATRPAAAQGLISGAGVCTLMPETTAGPFYFDPRLDRSDIAEGRPGVRLSMRFQIVDAVCTPLPGVRLDVWHCDAQGAYSGYAGQPGGLDTRGEAFMRGTRRSAADGTVEFSTIYPGWYPGRTSHVHFTAILADGRRSVTGQMFFPDAVSRQIYESVAPYSSRPAADATYNDRDGIARRAGAPALAELTDRNGSLSSALVIAIAL
jgi:protocatechuate 3,4-dioxygenase beta subunit